MKAVIEPLPFVPTIWIAGIFLQGSSKSTKAFLFLIILIEYFPSLIWVRVNQNSQCLRLPKLIEFTSLRKSNLISLKVY